MITKTKPEISATKRAEQMKEQIMYMYSVDMSANKIGKVLGFQAGVVLKVLRNEGVEVKTRKFIEINQKTLENEFVNGMSARDLAAKHNCSHETILKRLRGKVFTTKLERIKSFSKEIVSKYVVELKSINSISHEFKCTSKTIKTILKEFGITLRENDGKYSNLDEIGIVSEYESGFTSPEIASKYGCSEGKVLAVLKNRNVIIRKRGSRPEKD